MDWSAKLFGLDEAFHNIRGKGGGVLQVLNIHSGMQDWSVELNANRTDNSVRLRTRGCCSSSIHLYADPSKY